MTNTRYGCYRCGVIEGEVVKLPDGRYGCRSCGEVSILTFVQAMDMLNALYRENQAIINIPEDDILDEVIQLTEEL